MCEAAFGLGFDPLLHVPKPDEMKKMCQLPECVAFLNHSLPIAKQNQACWIPGTKLELASDLVERTHEFCQTNEDPNPPLDQPSSLQLCDPEVVQAVFDTDDATKCEFLLDDVVMKPPIKILRNNESELLCEAKECRTMVTKGLQVMINKPECLVPKNTKEPLALRGHFLERAQQYCQYRPEKPKWSCNAALVEQLQRRGNMAPCQRELEAVLKDHRDGNDGRFCPNKYCAAFAQDLQKFLNSKVTVHWMVCACRFGV